MVDVSRGRVPTVAAHRRTAMFAALTGYSHLLLYMEDTYEVGHASCGTRRTSHAMR